jgi:hypothetical protein
MDFNFNEKLAETVKQFSATLSTSRDHIAEFEKHPTETIKTLLQEKGVTVSRPDLFHAHAIKIGDQLPSEPERATIDRYIYIFRASGLFEFKVVPGSKDGNDGVMSRAEACCCCNCCVLEV